MTAFFAPAHAWREQAARRRRDQTAQRVVLSRSSTEQRLRLDALGEGSWPAVHCRCLYSRPKTDAALGTVEDVVTAGRTAGERLSK